MTALDKQAREFEKLAKEYLWGAYANAKDEFEEVAELVKLLTQVREQTVAECCKAICLYCASPERYAPAEMDKEGFVSHRFAGRDAEAAMCIAGPIKRALPAPPETTEQDGK